jgi:hypothetical protein
MAEAVGTLILAAITAAEATTIGSGIAGLGTLAGTTIAGVSVATIVGTTAIIGVSIGLQYALNNPQVPKPENGAVPLKQSIPPRIRGYWINRLSGYYILFLAAGGDSQDVLAFHSGRIEEVMQLYLHDVAVSVSPNLNHETIGTVATVGANKFNGPINVQMHYGTETQSVGNGLLGSAATSGLFTPAHAGKGIAAIAMFCAKKADATAFSKCYPQGLPLPSVVAKCYPIWDPRDVAQSYEDRSTWTASPNPVLQLINYLTESDGGMGENISEILPDSMLDLWMAEADLCDELMGSRPRYASAGNYRFDNAPENVIGKILAACDGWLAENGDGTLSLTVGYYREPTEPALTETHLFSISVKYGVADEDAVNQLDVTFTNPAAGYVSDQITSIRDEDAISASGIVRSRQLDLSWVQNSAQAAMLAERAMLRSNPELSGTIVTTLYGMQYVGKRWVKLNFPNIPGLENCVVEIQDKANIDLVGGKVTFKWQLIDPVALLALQ